jgi:hypothetical protein
VTGSGVPVFVPVSDFLEKFMRDPFEIAARSAHRFSNDSKFGGPGALIP